MTASRGRSLVIRNGLIVTAGSRFRADLRIGDGRIVEIGERLPADVEADVIDAAGHLVLPGGVDPHVHLSPPWVDDLTTGSKAALAGGITTLGVMSYPDPPDALLEVVGREGARIRREAIADIMLHTVIRSPTRETLATLPRLAEAGHTSIKIYMVSPTFDENAAGFTAVMEAAWEAGLLVMMHCEDAGIVARAIERLRSAGRASLRHYAESRPVEAEEVATRRAVAMCEATGAPIYVVHLSSERVLRVCEEARARDLPVYVETRPMYLHLTEERLLEPDGPLYVGQPPLRKAEDVDALWTGLASGAIDTVATDHAPWTREQKMDPRLTVATSRAGVNNLEVMLPMLYSEGVRTGRISLERFVAVTSTNAARLFGLYPEKGTIAVGSDADLVLFDPEATRPVRGSETPSRAGFSIYEGWTVTGWPRIVLRRGEIVYRDGALGDEPGSGRLLTRERFTRP
ncbi:MAG: amidohydrolase family protein [Gemmatimonadetes bacterium]|nr:amidohydrolase family protein [Gemmatimonadota bacterium]